jgi:hypothetical protein
MDVAALLLSSLQSEFTRVLLLVCAIAGYIVFRGKVGANAAHDE